MNKFVTSNVHQVNNVPAPAKLRHLENLRAFAEHISSINEMVIVPMTNFVHAMIFPRKLGKPLIVFIDGISNTPFYIWDSQRPKPDKELYGLDMVLFEEDMDVVKKVLDKLCNRVLPNLSHQVSSQLYDVIIAACEDNLSDVVESDIVKLINSAAVDNNLLVAKDEFRVNDKLYSELRGVFRKYCVGEPIPSDIKFNTEKSWVYHGMYKKSNVCYPVLITLNHENRNSSHSISVTVTNPAYTRRGFTYQSIK